MFEQRIWRNHSLGIVQAYLYVQSSHTSELKPTRLEYQVIIE